MTILNLNIGATTRTLMENGLQWAIPILMQRGNIFPLAFDVMKVLPAFEIICSAENNGVLKPGALVAETSSGSFAFGLGIVCALRGYKLHIVSDRSIEGEFERGLRALGAEVNIVDAPRDAQDVQQRRMSLLTEILKNHNAFWPKQYDNFQNALAYGPAAEVVSREIGAATDLVAPVGSGGVSQGLSRLLRLANPMMRMAGVDTYNSVLFGLKAGKRELRGLGNSLMPKNLIHPAFDDVHWVDANLAYSGVIDAQRDGLGEFGPTSGAAYVVGRWIARDPSRRVVIVFPDRGLRYRNLIAEWKQSGACVPPPTEPHYSVNLHDVTPPWSHLAWRRRTLYEVQSESGAEAA